MVAIVRPPSEDGYARPRRWLPLPPSGGTNHPVSLSLTQAVAIVALSKAATLPRALTQAAGTVALTKAATLPRALTQTAATVRLTRGVGKALSLTQAAG